MPASPRSGSFGTPAGEVRRKGAANQPLAADVGTAGRRPLSSNFDAFAERRLKALAKVPMLRRASSLGFSIAVFSFASALSSRSFADEQGGFALGLRVGYAFPMGKEGRTPGETGSDDLSDDISGMVPLWIDVGYRINPSLYVGGFFQYGFALVNTDKNPGCNQVSCSAHDIRFGANLHYHIRPAASFDPWLGAGIGYEVLSFKISTAVLGQTFVADGNVQGFEFLNLQAGGDFKVSREVGMGPFLSFSLGQYATYSRTGTGLGVTANQSGDLTDTGVHEWFVICLLVQYNL